MGHTRRKEYYFTKGHVELIVNERPSGFGPWPKRSNHKDLVIAIEEDEGGNTHIFPGPSYTKERERDALLLHRGLYLNQNNSDIDRRLPMTVIKPVIDKIATAAKKMVQKFARLSNEERMTGALFSDIELDEQIDGWSVRIYHHGFSSITKEPHVGADLGIIIDISNDESRVIKVVWFQTKRATRLDTPESVQALPGLSEQLADMRKFTSDGYGLIYSPTGVTVWASGQDTEYPRLKPVGRLEKFMEKTLHCEYGDRKPDAIANTLDCKHIVGVTLMHGPYARD